MSGSRISAAVLNLRRFAVVEGLLGFAAVLAAVFFASQGATLSVFFLSGTAVLLLGVGWRTWQLAATVGALAARVDRKQSPLAYLTSRDAGRLGWTRKAMVICVSEHYLYVFRATVRASEPEARIAYGDLMGFDLGSGTTKALIKMELPARTFLLGGLMRPEVDAVESILQVKRPDLLGAETIAARLEEMFSD